MSNEKNPEEKIRRAIALLTQVREELMNDDCREFWGGADPGGLVGSKSGELRANLQLHLRHLGVQEKLEDESLQGILDSRSKSPIP